MGVRGRAAWSRLVRVPSLGVVLRIEPAVAFDYPPWAAKGVAMTDDIHKAELAIEASESSLLEAAAHIERAAEKNDDPAVAQELHDAALATDTTAARVGWLRATLTRLFRRQSA